MTKAKYIIVGADVGDAQNRIDFDENGTGVITALAGSFSDEGTEMARLNPDTHLAEVVGNGPLTVESIGRLMVHISENRSPSDAELGNYKKIVGYSLLVLERPRQGKLSRDDKAAILANTEVEIEFEKRNPVQGAPDKNIRVLVVPADGTLLEGQTATSSMAPPYLPPLSYELDTILMLSYLRTRVSELLTAFDGSQVPDWETTLLPALLEHAASWIDENTYNQVGGQPDPDDEFNKILDAPVRAYHRAVGIYGTNMCR